METLAQSTVDPWASISVPSPRRHDAHEHEHDDADETMHGTTTTTRMTTRTRRTTRSTKTTTTGQRSRLGKSSSKRREDDDVEDEAEDEGEEDDDVVDTEGEVDDDDDAELEDAPKRGTTKGRTTSTRRVAFQEEAENAALSSMGRTRAATTPSRPRKGIVRDEVEKINQRGGKAKPLSRDRTNEKGIRDSSEGSETATANATHRGKNKALNSSDDSFITASIDPWGAPLVSPGTMRQVAKATKKRAQGDVPLSPQRYDAVQSRGGQSRGTTTTVAKKAKETKTARLRASQAFGSPTAEIGRAHV